MIRKGFFLTILSLCGVLCFNSYAAHKHYSKKRGNVRTHSTYKKQSKTIKKERSAEFARQDSLLNAPTEKAQIVYDDRDIPCDFIIKLDSTLKDYQANNRVIPENCEFDSTYPGILSDSIYISRLQSIPSVVELTYNNIVRDYIALYTIRKRKLTSMILGQSQYYFPIFDDALDAEGVPFELKYLPVIESALNPKAYSPAGASGLWQFISSTGRMYGLKINSLIDERRDPIKASSAAARYLKHLYSIYNNWTLVIAAYNCGPGNVNKAIRRAGGIKDYWAIYPYLPKETRGYVPAFIAATYTMNFSNEHKLCPKKIDREFNVDTIHVTDQVHFEQVSAVLGIDIKELRSLNPQYRHDIIPGNTSECTLVLPTDKLNQYEMYKNTILSYDVPGYDKHRPYVEPKQLAYNHTAKKKKQVHKEIRKDSILLAKADSSVKDSVTKIQAEGQQDFIAQQKQQKKKESNTTLAANSNSKVVTKEAKAKDDQQYTVKVKEGDTLYAIALRNRVSVINLKKWNSLQSDDLRIGQVIVVKKK